MDKFMNDVFNNILNFESISQYTEIGRILENFNYKITDAQSQKLNSTLITLYDNGYNIGKILEKYSADDFNFIDDIIKKVINEIYSDKNDNIILNNQYKFSENQRNYIYEVISGKINEENNYIYNRLPLIFRILIKSKENNLVLLNILKLILDSELLRNDKILKEYDELIQISEVFIIDEFINLYIQNLIEKNLSSSPENILKIICKYKKKISLENIEKLESYTKIILNENTYKYIFDIYKEKSNLMLEKENTALQLEKFLINNIDISSDLGKTLDLIKTDFKKLNNINAFLKKYIEINFNNNITLERKYWELITYYFVNESAESQNLIIYQLLSSDSYNKETIERIINLFSANEFIKFNSMVSGRFLKSFEDFNKNCKINYFMLLIYLNKINDLIEYLSFLFEDLSDEEFIKNILIKLENSKIRISRGENFRLWQILNKASNSTSSGSLKESVEMSIKNLRLREIKKGTKENNEEKTLVP